MNATDASPAAPERPLYVVGIGASAGGLEALEHFFDHVTPEGGMAFVVVQHLSPDFKSLMEELLGRHTDLAIHLVEDGMRVEPDHIYLIPPKKQMIIAHGRLHLSEREKTQELTLPIDVFFRSLAQDCGEHAIAVVLSGGGSDGSRGIKDVHQAGGLVIVQDVESAQFDGMPRAARDVGVASFILAPQDMPALLVDHVRTAGEATTLALKAPTPAPGGVEAIYEMLQEEFGLDFTLYKPSTVTRRIERRLRLAHAGDVGEYVDRLRSGKGELDVLYRDLLIGVTRFFRDEEAFAVLEEKVLPELLSKGPTETPFRVWVAGCATGEEAYSLAILLSELSAKHGGRAIKIFATDVHHGSIEQAGRAIYGKDSLAEVSPERLDRYFHRRGDGYQVIPDIRQMVVFAQHNVIRDAPFTRMDLVSCRNMLIYFQLPAQHKVLGLFHFALNRGGVLFLGPSESPGPLLDDYEVVNQHWRVYRKHRDMRLAVEPRLLPARQLARSPVAALASVGRHSISGLLATYDTLLDEVMAPSLLVTEHGELVHAFAGASKFLKVRDGRQDLDVLEGVDEELRMVLVGGLQRVKTETSAVVFRGVRIAASGVEALHQVTIRRVAGRSAHVLITIAPVEGAVIPRVAPAARELDLDEVSRERLNALEGELSYTKENLQSAVEQLETSNEELQAANEELIASNEELQSTNEELQSVNEELYTVNAEYQRKIAELTELTNDIDNLLTSTDVGALFLDAQLRIRKFTPQIAGSFALLPHDIGRSIETFAHRLDHPELNEELRRVLETGVPVERELRAQGVTQYFLRILPYRAKGAIQGVVLTLIDVSGLKAAEDALFHERYLFNSLLSSSPDAIYFKDLRGRFIRANQAMAARLRLADPREAQGKTAFELPDSHGALELHRQDEVVLQSGEPQPYRLEKRVRRDGADAWDLVTRLPLVDAAKKIVGVIGVFRDVTAQKRSEERIGEAMKRRDEFLAMLSHELRNPLSALISATTLLKSGAVEPAKRGHLLEIVERQSKQMARLLDDLLEVGRVTQNKIELRKQTIDLRSVLKDATDAVRGFLKGKDITFTMELGTRPLLVDGDPARLQQVHVNLLNNAAKYTPRGGNVTLHARVVDGDVVVAVKDDGAGISTDMLEDVFELFVQSHRTLERSEGGLGVGLTLVRALVDMHGGSVGVKSDGEGAGSEFMVRLPLSRGVQDEPERGAAHSSPRRGTRIAVVEDNPDACELLTQLLVLSGFECESAARGDDGLELIRTMRPDIALVDVGLPGIDGFEVARRVRADATLADVWLVALTGYGQPDDRAHALGAGFDAHVVKPIDYERLMEQLATAPVRERRLPFSIEGATSEPVAEGGGVVDA